MAYGPGAVGKDGNRGIHGGTYAGDEAHMPDTANPVGSLSVPQGKLLGQPSMNGPTAPRQTMPNPADYGRTDVASKVSGESELLGQGVLDEGIKDDEYPSIGGIDKQGEPDGFSPVDWNAVGTYEYEDYGKQPSPGQKMADGIGNVLPLT